MLWKNEFRTFNGSMNLILNLTHLIKLIKSKGEMDVSTALNRNLLDLEKWHQLFQNGNEDLVKSEMGNLQTAIEDIQKVI